LRKHLFKGGSRAQSGQLKAPKEEAGGGSKTACLSLKKAKGGGIERRTRGGDRNGLEKLPSIGGTPRGHWVYKEGRGGVEKTRALKKGKRFVVFELKERGGSEGREHSRDQEQSQEKVTWRRKGGSLRGHNQS